MSESPPTVNEPRAATGETKEMGWADQLARDVDGHVHHVEAAWIDELERGVILALRRLAEELVAANASAGELLEGSLETRSDIRAAAGNYRALVAEDVIGKMGRYLRSTAPERKATEVTLAQLDALERFMQTVPESIDDIVGEDPYGPEPGEGWFTRVRKALVRVGRKMRRGPKPRRVPVQLLAAYHLKVRTARRLVSRHMACIRRLCRVLSDLEEVFSDWTHPVLSLEEALDDAAYYSPDDFELAIEPGGDDDLTVEEARDRLMAIASGLTMGLQRLVAGLDFEVPPDRRDDASALFRRDLAVAGTFLLDPDDRKLPTSAYLPSALLEEDQAPWIEWLSCSRNRMRINWHLLNLRAAHEAQLQALTERAAVQTIRPLFAVQSLLRDRMSDLQERLQAIFGDRSQDAERDSVLEEIDKLRTEVDSFVNDVTDRVGAFDEATDFLKDFGNSENEAVARSFGQLPGPLRIRVSPASSLAIEIGDATYEEVDLKSIANRMLGLRFSDQVRRHSDKLRLTVTRRWIDVEQAAEVVRFGLSAASEELREDVYADGSLEHARELAVEGFVRAIEMTESEEAELRDSWSQFVRGVVGVSLRDWSHLHRQVLGAELAEEWAGYGDRMRRGFQEIAADLRRLLSVVLERLTVFFRLGRRHAHTLIKRGQSVVGVSQVAHGRRRETVDAVARWGELIETLPLVYRRLFSFEPLSDDSHLVNRASDLAVVQDHYGRWCQGLSTNTLVLSSPGGSGRTTFMNVVEKSVFKDAEVKRIELVTRYRSEGQIVDDIASALGISLDGDPTFACLEGKLLNSRTSTPRVCIVDNLEHAMLRVPGGSDLIEALLIFFSRTDEVVYWISSIGHLARHFLEKTIQIGGFIDFYTLSSFDRESTQAMLLARHRKSGLPLKFEAPEDLGAIMKQRLRRAKSEQEQQGILSGAFFERLHKDSGQNLRLALFYWIRSIEFNSGADEMAVRSVRTLNLDFLNDLDLRSAFSLKAVLFHRSLTLDEHNQLFRVSNREGTVIMESLLNSGLIVQAGKGQASSQVRIEPGIRYRVHPLLIHPITDHLRGRHIVY